MKTNLFSASQEMMIWDLGPTNGYVLVLFSYCMGVTATVHQDLIGCKGRLINGTHESMTNQEKKARKA
jgi:hypothetical protein